MAFHSLTDTSVAPSSALPKWDLSDLFPSPTSPEFVQLLAYTQEQAQLFQTRYQGNVSSASAENLALMIKEYEQLQDQLGKLGSYAQLYYTQNMLDSTRSQFYQNTMEQLNVITTWLIFFTIELNQIEDSLLITHFTHSPSLSHYEPWLRDVRAARPHQLSQEMETLLHEKHVTGQQSWQRLFDETLAKLQFPFEGKQLSSAEIFHLLSSSDRNIRKKAAKTIGDVLEQHAPLFALITNVLAKDKEIEDKWRKFSAPISSRNLANLIEDEVVECLIESVKSAYPRLSHRYYQLKARWFGWDTLEYWDRNAPYPQDTDSHIPWQEAVSIVTKAYADFSPTLASLVTEFFEKNWIDAAPSQGKESGAFSHPTVPSAHPYILMNYQGKLRDVMTLAHELGHGVHQMLARKQGALMCDTPLTLAETASVFGEQLTFRALLQREQDPQKKALMLANKIEDMLNTVVRQIAFCTFEKTIHHERRQGEISLERLGAIWMDAQKESLGPAFHFDPEYQFYWCYISHFIHAPFYVYAYAFGDCLVNALYQEFLNHPEGFEEKYLTMLTAGGSLRHKALLAPFGLDATQPDFWQRGLQVIEHFIEELERYLPASK